MLDRILKAASGRCEQAEAYLYRASRTPVEFRNNRLKSIETVDNEVLSLRVIAGGRLGFSTTTKASDIEGLVDSAVAVAADGEEATYSFASPADAPELDLFTGSVRDLSIEKMVDVGRDFIDAVRTLDPGILGGANIEKATHQVRVANTLGASHCYDKTTYGVFFGGELVEGQNFLHVYDGQSRTDLEVDTEAIKQQVLRDFRLARKNVEFTSGEYPVILTPSALQFLFMRYMACLNGKAVEKGISPWTTRMGEKVLDSGVTFHDDPGLAGAAGSVPVDDEGVPAVRKHLVERGVITSFVLDLATASALSMAPTGNGFRDKPLLNSPPQPSTSNLVMEAGETPVEDMISGVRDGVLVDQLMGAWAGNPYSGEVTGNISLGYRISGGQVMGRIKDAMLSANAFEALSTQIAGISRERKWGWGKTYLPYVLLEGVNIATKS